MPREARSIMKARLFHIMVQGIEKKFIFDNPANMQKYLDLLYINSSKNKVYILSYCIMNNHAHILVYTSKPERLIKFFRCVNTAYAKYFNFKNNRVGYVFRNRYRSEEIFSLSHLCSVIKYIHNNPVKANICINANEYRYSSYNEYFKKSVYINKKILYKYFKKEEVKEFFR